MKTIFHTSLLVVVCLALIGNINPAYAGSQDDDFAWVDAYMADTIIELRSIPFSQWERGFFNA